MPTTSDESPKVLAHHWGRIEVAALGAFRDVKLWPGGGRAWNWDETGTRHQPGIQPADLEDLLAHDPEVVVLTRGRELRLETMAATLEVLEQRGVRVVWEETSIAIDTYNELVTGGVRAAALVHSTC